MKRSWSGAYCISQATSYAAEMKSEWKLPDAWPSEEGQNMYWFLFGPENCMSCVRLREGGGEPPQVKQLFEDEIIVWLHLFTPMAQRGAAKQHNWLCYLIAASASLCKDIFSESLAEGHFVRQLCHQAFLLSNHPSDGLLISSNKKLILDASAEGNTWCMYVSKTALWHVVNVNKLSSPFALKWNLHICCFWGKTAFCTLTLFENVL